MDFGIFLTSIFNGFQNGAIYATVAVALVLIFKATTLINFAQGELAMLGAFFVYVMHVENGIWFWLAIVIGMLVSAGMGATIERVLVRPFDPSDHLPVVLITLGLFLIINAVAGDVWNFTGRPFPSLFDTFPSWMPGIGGDRFIEIAGARLFYETIGTWMMLGLMMLVLTLVLNRTKIGLAFRAVSSNTESARLVGVRTGRTLQFGWALASAFGTLGAVLVAPRLLLSPNMMATVLIYALAGAALGGLDSLKGAIVGGVAVGLIQSVFVSWLLVTVLEIRWMNVLQLAFAFFELKFSLF